MGDELETLRGLGTGPAVVTVAIASVCPTNKPPVAPQLPTLCSLARVTLPPVVSPAPTAAVEGEDPDVTCECHWLGFCWRKESHSVGSGAGRAAGHLAILLSR